VLQEVRGHKELLEQLEVLVQLEQLDHKVQKVLPVEGLNNQFGAGILIQFHLLCHRAELA
jgi:hypothetical protein